MRRRVPFLCVVVVAALVAAGCTSGPSPAGTASPTDVVETSAAPPASPTPLPTPTGPPLTAALAAAHKEEEVTAGREAGGERRTGGRW